MQTLSLEFMTVLGLSPPDIVSVASDVGYDTVSICLTPSPVLGDKVQPLVGNRGLVEQTAQRVRETGVRMSLGEGFVIAPEATLESFREPIDIATELGARCINCTIIDPDRKRALDLLSALADLAAQSGVETAAEFSSYSPIISNLALGLAAINEIGNEHLGLLVDLMHIVRNGNRAADVANIPRRIIKYAQICDGPLTSPSHESYRAEAVFDRRMPGEGEFGVREFLSLLPQDVVVGVEVPSKTLEQRGLTFRERAKYAFDATQAILATM